MKKTITAIILAALILAAFPILIVPNAKASAAEANVVSYSYYTASANSLLAAKAGDLVVVGEIQNVGSNIIQNVTLTGTAYNSNGTELGTGQGTAFVYETIPNGRAPFSIDIAPQSSSTSQIAASSVGSVTVTVLSVTDTVVPPYSGFKVPATPTAFNNSGVYTTVGTIVNNGSQTLGYIWVVTTFYNNAHTVVGLNFTNYVNTPLAPLSPGHATRWVATPIDNTMDLSNEIASSSYVIDSMPYSTSTSTATPTPTGSGSSSPFPTLPVVVVVVVVVVAVVALMLLRKRQGTETPLPPPPPPPPTPEATENPSTSSVFFLRSPS